MQKMISVNDYYKKNFQNRDVFYGLYTHQMEEAINHMINSGIEVLQVIQTSQYDNDKNKAKYSALIKI